MTPPHTATNTGSDAATGSGIDHVVVLMLENRSYDHMLGLLTTDPAYEGIVVDDPRFANSYRLAAGGSREVRVSADGSPLLTVDPPHSHRSARIQLGLDTAASPTMRGFITAYGESVAAAAGGTHNDRPDIRRTRIAVAALALPLAIAALLALPSGWPLLVAAALTAAALVALVNGVRRELGPVLPFGRWWVVLAVPPLVVAALAAGSWWLGTRFGVLVRIGLLLTLFVLAGGVIVAIARAKRPPPPSIAPEFAERIMACMAPEQIPVLAMLARSFTVCTRWHCSVPGATWPNRNFAHAGWSQGTVDIEAGLYDDPTIFDRLHDHGVPWRIYRDPESVAQVMVYRSLWQDESKRANWRVFDDFAADVAAGRLAAYSFIEPCHEGPTSNSQHPGNNDFDAPPGAGASTDFGRGERLIAEIYDALRSGPDELFDRTILLITYDEHGGFYDHVPPPTDAIPPHPTTAITLPSTQRLIRWFVRQPDHAFGFDVLGPRVPAVVAGGRVPRAAVDVAFDHSSIPRTVRSLFAPAAPKLTDREDAAATFDRLASLATGRTDLPDVSPREPDPNLGFGPLSASAATPKPRSDDFLLKLDEIAAAVDTEIQQQSTGFGPLTAAAPSNRMVGRRFTEFTSGG